MADMKSASIASFPGHLITSLSGNLYRLKQKRFINLLGGLYHNLSTECFAPFYAPCSSLLGQKKRVKQGSKDPTCTKLFFKLDT